MKFRLFLLFSFIGFVLCWNTQESKTVKLAYTVRNQHPFPAYFTKGFTPFLIGSGFLDVYLNEEKIGYQGPLSCLGDVEDIYLDPGQTITVHFIVDRYYDLSAPGHYTVSALEEVVRCQEPVLETFLSLPLIEQGKKGFSIWNKIAFWQKPVHARLSKSNTIVLDLL